MAFGEIEEYEEEPTTPLTGGEELGKPSQVTRVRSGVPGLDDLLQGGIPCNSLVLVTGSCGNGKSTFGMQFLCHGAQYEEEPGIYLTLEEPPKQIIDNACHFGWDVRGLINDKKLNVVEPELYKWESLVTTIEDSVMEIGAKRLVLDSATILGMYFNDQYKIRRSFMDLSRILRKINCTTFMISEREEGANKYSVYGVEEFVVDGVIVLYFIKEKNMFMRALAVRKMRSTNHSTKIYPFKIASPGGIKVYPSAEIFGDV